MMEAGESSTTTTTGSDDDKEKQRQITKGAKTEERPRRGARRGACAMRELMGGEKRPRRGALREAYVWWMVDETAGFYL